MAQDEHAGGESEEQTPAEPPPAGGAPDGEAKPGAPPRPKQAEAKTPAKEPPPPGGIAGLLKEALPDVALDAYQGMSHVIVEVQPGDIAKIMPVARDDPRLDLKFLRCLFGVDHEADGFEVIYQLMSLEKGHDVVIKTRLPRENPKVASVASIWRAADWHERETRDMFGIDFDGHPHLVPLLLPEDMTDHFPLRKDNVLPDIEEWQATLVAEGAGDGEEEAEE